MSGSFVVLQDIYKTLGGGHGSLSAGKQRYKNTMIYKLEMKNSMIGRKFKMNFLVHVSCMVIAFTGGRYSLTFTSLNFYLCTFILSVSTKVHIPKHRHISQILTMTLTY